MTNIFPKYNSNINKYVTLLRLQKRYFGILLYKLKKIELTHTKLSQT